jgi:hypothetical protein
MCLVCLAPLTVAALARLARRQPSSGTAVPSTDACPSPQDGTAPLFPLPTLTPVLSGEGLHR